MKFQRLISKSKLLSGIHSLRTRYLLTILLAALGTALFPSTSRATFQFIQGGPCNPPQGCNQSINSLAPNETAPTVLGDTNPPPVYTVSATSNGVLNLHWSGSTIDTGVGGPGFTLLTLTPQATFAWDKMDFQLDSLINLTAPSTGLLLTATDQFGQSFSGALNFPWEGNNGENQHYEIFGLNGEAITKLTISYTAPVGTGNTIQDIHNIDVHTVRTPEPSSLFLLGIALIAMERFLPRKH